MKVKADLVVKTALSLPPQNIPYVMAGETLAGMDCQGMVEYCVRANGGRMSYAGSNDMYRNAWTWRGTIAEARAQGKLVPDRGTVCKWCGRVHRAVLYRISSPGR